MIFYILFLFFSQVEIEDLLATAKIHLQQNQRAKEVERSQELASVEVHSITDWRRKLKRKATMDTIVCWGRFARRPKVRWAISMVYSEIFCTLFYRKSSSHCDIFLDKYFYIYILFKDHHHRKRRELATTITWLKITELNTSATFIMSSVQRAY